MVIYCEGAQARFNPLWSWLPFNVVKGEALHLDLKGKTLDNVVKNNVNIIPLEGQNTYWIGSNYEWNPTDSSPTPSIKDDFLNELNTFLNVDYQVIAHKSAIRPATKDRRLFIGFHPENPFCAIFNGLGAKGTSLAPFWANHFVNVLLESEKLSNVMDIQRF
jgi:glycine/D-amino acid oxidase-like deaminating enzyme